MAAPVVVILFSPPFIPLNLRRGVGIAGGFRLFTGGGTGGADLLPEGEGIDRGGTLRESGSGSDRMVLGTVISYIPIDSLRMGCSGRSCVGGVVSGRLCLDERLEAMATFGKLLELSVLALRMTFPLWLPVGSRRFSRLFADLIGCCLGHKRWLSCFVADF